MESLVSIIVPVYNCERFLNKCLNSILTQTYFNIEVIVVNDGSSDNSHDIISMFERRDKRVIYLQQENAGVAVARNLALQYAKGKYYLFVDADDYIGEDYVNELVACAEKNSSELVICGYTLVYPDKNREKRVIPGEYEKGIKEEWAYRISAVCSRLYSSNFWKRESLAFVKEENARGEDVPIAMYANAMARNICVIPFADYFYVQHADSAMHQKKGNILFQFPYQSFRKMYQRIQKQTFQNDKVYFDIGVLKFLAQFEFSIYRKADSNEKNIFKKYINELLQDDWSVMISEWKLYRRNIQFPMLHKVAIELFILKYR